MKIINIKEWYKYEKYGFKIVWAINCSKTEKLLFIQK